MNSYIRVTSNWSFSLNFFSSVKQSSAESNLQFFILFLIHTHTHKGKLKKNSMLYDEIWSDVTAVLFLIHTQKKGKLKKKSMLYDEIWSDVTAVLFSPFIGFNCIYCIQFNPSLKTTLKVKIACWSEGWTHDQKLWVQIPAGAVREFSSPELTLRADSYSVSIPPSCYRSGT